MGSYFNVPGGKPDFRGKTPKWEKTEGQNPGAGGLKNRVLNTPSVQSTLYAPLSRPKKGANKAILRRRLILGKVFNKP